MKKQILLTMILLALSLAATADEKEHTLGFDGFMGVNFGILDEENNNANSSYFLANQIDMTTLRFFLVTTRLDFGLSARYYLSQNLSTGAEFIFSCMRFPEKGKDLYLVSDVPLRIIVRYGSDKTFLQGFGGYNFSFGEFGGFENRYDSRLLSGPEIGVKGALGGVYISGSIVFSEMITFPRFSLGYSKGFSF